MGGKLQASQMKMHSMKILKIYIMVYVENLEQNWLHASVQKKVCGAGGGGGGG